MHVIVLPGQETFPKPHALAVGLEVAIQDGVEIAKHQEAGKCKNLCLHYFYSLNL